MDTIDKKEIDKLIKLCRIECTEEEKKALQSHLVNILKYAAELEEVDVEGVEPCYRILQTLKNVMREDTVGELLPRELFLANAPSHVAGLIRTPPVLKSS
ncbi:MAG TPA: Asp-tRNA(Asn)/Glu-tRNA(Gln) amidotransferase subunit GatC [Rhabdochlamydiaceae bacterium]|jgi:aspartyl-tRNA(Asn)/glutamyl-tRNA(Gln) amidotransferase subunit C